MYLTWRITFSREQWHLHSSSHNTSRRDRTLHCIPWSFRITHWTWDHSTCRNKKKVITQIISPFFFLPKPLSWNNQIITNGLFCIPRAFQVLFELFIWILPLFILTFSHGTVPGLRRKCAGNDIWTLDGGPGVTGEHQPTRQLATTSLTDQAD